VAGTVAALARRAGSLTVGGQWAAFVTGTLVAAAGLRWAALLIVYFVASSALTRMGETVKAARTESMLPAAGARNATQVAANGGVFALLMILGTVFDAPVLLVAGLGALAAAAADTWATEIGTLWGGTPRSILTFAPVEPGASGGITPLGTLASLVAALLVALAGALLLSGSTAWSHEAATFASAIVVAGIAGSVGDSLLGATLQSKRWCEQCRTWTERRVHTCQYRTQHTRGVRWMTNDTVNFLATVVGASVGALVLRSL
jgi:uncharacterized protein (TIGR00297 family)